MHAGVGPRSVKGCGGAPAPLRSSSYSVQFQSWVGPPEPSCACMVAGGTAPPSLPAHHREFVYVSLLPSSCQEAPQRGTADYSVLWATPSRQEWMGFSAYSIRRRFFSHPRRSLHQFQNTHTDFQRSLYRPNLTELCLMKQVLKRKLNWNPKWNSTKEVLC